MITMSKIKRSFKQVANNQGFTLIEMAIVLIIIGIIIGAVIKGKDLIRSAEQKKIYTKYLNAWRMGYANCLFIDGVEQSLSTVRGSSHANRTVDSNFRISGWMNNSGYRFNGLMDELRIYKRGLSSSEVVDDKDLTH